MGKKKRAVKPAQYSVGQQLDILLVKKMELEVNFDHLEAEVEKIQRELEGANDRVEALQDQLSGVEQAIGEAEGVNYAVTEEIENLLMGLGE